VTPLGSAHLETFTSFLAKWQAGKVKDLKSGLADVDEQVDAKMKQAG
jgi:multiple sugar transport system substrate-binding protein